jgi:asparagine synthase (glutamine-hydrolysing)
MCRIFGHFAADVSPSQFRVASMMQRHGGPDGRYTAWGPGWGLGNNRLAIVDLDGGQQPFDWRGLVKVVFNGEIYNHEELRKELVALGHQFTDRCDGSIIPALYVEYGLDFVERIEGMFAIAIVDLRGEPKLVLLTDHVGMKSVYYHWQPAHRRLYFASELPALLSFANVDRTAWSYGLESYLATKTPLGEQTMFEGVRVLAPGSTLTLSRSGGLAVRRRGLASTPDDGDLDSTALRLRELLTVETARLSTADVPACAITSGGLDSSLVTALASKAVDGLHTFNIAYKGKWPFDERHFAAEIGRQYGTRHHQVELDPLDFVGLLGEVVWHLGQPNADPITLSTYALFEAVHEAGFKVALTGDGADELFGGYGRIRDALSGGPRWADAYVDALAAVPRAARATLYSAAYRAHIEQLGWQDDKLREQLRAGPHDRLAAISDFEITQRMPAYHLRRVDHLSMAHSVEARIPFCQPQVVRFAAGLADDKKIVGRSVKRVLYEAARPLVPESILNRPKQPFTLPITAMLHTGSALMEQARDTLSSAGASSLGMLNPAAVQRLFAQQESSPNDEAALALWSLLIFELWVEQFGTRRPRLDPMEVSA